MHGTCWVQKHCGLQLGLIAWSIDLESWFKEMINMIIIARSGREVSGRVVSLERLQCTSTFIIQDLGT